MLTPSKLKALVAEEKIESVMVCFPDIYGRLMGKTCDAEYFVESTLTDGTHGCDYLLACDMNMTPIPGFKFANWERGYGDVHFVPDLSTLRLMSWRQKTAMVICDLKHNHEPVQVAPRTLLRSQIDRAAKLMYTLKAASELEYYIFESTYREAAATDYHPSKMRTISDVVEDYHTLQAAREERFNAPFRRHLKLSGVPVENSKGEAGIGQHELNVKFSNILTMCDRHAVYKQAIKEIADQLGGSVTFMAKPYTDYTGSGCHIHLSVHTGDGVNVFPGKDVLHKVKCSPVFRHFLGGWLKYTPDVMVFYAPTINSYKRYVSSSWAPTRIAWSYDNRTAGYRVVGEGKSLRIECRIPGADANPYLAFAGAVASGLAGIEEQIEPPPIFEGNIYEARQMPEVPKTLNEAIRRFEQSDMVKAAFGQDVVDHYVHWFKNEQACFDRAVTDWERKRYFEQI